MIRAADLSPAALAALLGRLPLTHPLITAARVGIEMAGRRAGVETNRDHDCGWHRHHDTGPSSIAVRRWPPFGDREMWVKYGPAGPPLDEGRTA